MAAPVLIEHEGRLIGWREIVAATGISRRQANARIRRGLRGAALFAPKADKKQAAKMNPDPFGWSWRRKAA